VHQAKGKSSDRGIAFHQLITGCKATLTLTGTFFGGKSTSIFWLLHRLNPGVRRDFAFAEEMRWAKLYGVLTVTRKGKGGNELDEEDGVFTGNRRYRNQAKEEPGISPAIINRLLDTTVFLSLKDLGVNMPEYREEVAVLDMEDAHLEQYEGLNDVLKRMARQNYRYLSTWLQWTLARPNSAFRDELVAVDEYDAAGEKTDRKLMLFDLPAVVSKDQRLPKEEWLANYCLAERKQSRKVLVYVRQTGTRDIQDHLETVLEKAGLRVTVLHGNIDPRKREEWIAKHTPATDVLVCNPKLVETGLDLIAYSTVVFLEIEYSLYTLWQAVRRVWRLGQQRPVKAVFAVYHGTMEARALELMGKKMKAAQLLYGDEVGGAIVPDEDGDFLTQLARDVLEGVSMQDLTTLFAEDAKISHGTLGSMTLPSEVMTIPVETWEAWKAERGLTQSTRRKGNSPTVLPGQASLF
jgi:SNF2 family DNA or RNA helicase